MWTFLHNGMQGIQMGISVLGRGIIKGAPVVTGVASEVVGVDSGGVLY
jgi:hypothetical protein